MPCFCNSSSQHLPASLCCYTSVTLYIYKPNLFRQTGPLLWKLVGNDKQWSMHACIFSFTSLAFDILNSFQWHIYLWVVVTSGCDYVELNVLINVCCLGMNTCNDVFVIANAWWHVSCSGRGMNKMVRSMSRTGQSWSLAVNCCCKFHPWHQYLVEMTPSTSVNFLLLIAANAGLQEEEPQTAYPMFLLCTSHIAESTIWLQPTRVLYMGISYSH